MYTVTEKGRRQLEAEVQRWQTFSRRMNQLLGLEAA